MFSILSSPLTTPTCPAVAALCRIVRLRLSCLFKSGSSPFLWLVSVLKYVRKTQRVNVPYFSNIFNNCLKLFIMAFELSRLDFSFPLSSSFENDIRMGGNQYLNHSISNSHRFSRLQREEGIEEKLLYLALIRFNEMHWPISFGMLSMRLLWKSIALRRVNLPMFTGSAFNWLLSTDKHFKKISSHILSGNSVSLLLDRNNC